MEIRWRDQVLGPSAPTRRRTGIACAPARAEPPVRPPDGGATLIDADLSRTYGPEELPRIRDALLSCRAGRAHRPRPRSKDPGHPAGRPVARGRKAQPRDKPGAGAQGAHRGRADQAGDQGAAADPRGALWGRNGRPACRRSARWRSAPGTILRRLKGETSDLLNGVGARWFSSRSPARSKARRGAWRCS